MKKLLILAILFCTPVFACDSYEDCLFQSSHTPITNRDDWEHVHLDIQTAIAYKLDEISHKLNKSTVEVEIHDNRGVQVIQKTDKTKQEYDCENEAGFLEYDTTTGVGHCIHAV